MFYSKAFGRKLAAKFSGDEHEKDKADAALKPTNLRPFSNPGASNDSGAPGHRTPSTWKGGSRKKLQLLRDQSLENGFQALVPSQMSLDPNHIDISGSPPLCCNCRKLLDNAHKTHLGQKITIISADSLRLKKSASLGCRICDMLLHCRWNVQHHDSLETSTVMSIDVADVQPIWICGIVQSAGDGSYLLTGSAISAFTNSGRVHILRNGLKWCETWSATMFFVPTTELVDLISNAQVSQQLTVEEAALTGTRWIQCCQQNHEQCESAVEQNKSWLPTRLIEVTCDDGEIKARLCESHKLQGSESTPAPPYATVSHCWGREKMFTTRRENFPAMKIQIPLLELTELLRNALSLAYHMGIKYIWIDSLCIIQDSREDWLKESVVMQDVYKNGLVNISGTAFPDGTHGLFPPRQPLHQIEESFNFKVRRELREMEMADDLERPFAMLRTVGYKILDPVSSTKDLVTESFHLYDDWWDSDIESSPLNARAWVFQERLLAKRVLHFGNRQMFWECRQLEACEALPAGIPGCMGTGHKGNVPFDSLQGDKADSTFMEYHAYMWLIIASGYNGTKLTKYEDKLIAVSGIAREFHARTGYKYIAGLWEPKLIIQLAWHIDNIADVAGGNSRPTVYQAPSWSWASVNRPVKNYREYGGSYQELATVHSHHIALANDDEFGQITSGWLQICGSPCHVSFTSPDLVLRMKDCEDVKQKLAVRGANGKKAFTIKPLLLPDETVSHHHKDGQVSFPQIDGIGRRDFYLLPLYLHQECVVGIILVPTVSKGEYARKGWWKLKDIDDHFDDFSTFNVSLQDHEYKTESEEGYVIKIV